MTLLPRALTCPMALSVCVLLVTLGMEPPVKVCAPINIATYSLNLYGTLAYLQI